MEGRERLVLLEPNEIGKTATGQPKYGNPNEHKVYAVRKDRGGPIIQTNNVETKEWETRFEIRNQGSGPNSFGARLSQKWSVRDDNGILYSVISVSFLDRAKRKLALYTARQ